MKASRLRGIVCLALLFVAYPAHAQRVQPADVADGRCAVPMPLWYGPAQTGREFVASKLCANRDGSLYDLAASLNVAATLFARDLAITGGFMVGDPRDGVGMTLTETGLAVQGRLGVRPKGARYFADAVVGSGGQVMTSGSAETASNGTSIVVFDPAFRQIANTANGAYLVIVGASGPEPVYWDEAASSPEQFVVRSVSGKRARFTFVIVARPADAGTALLRGENPPQLELFGAQR